MARARFLLQQKQVDHLDVFVWPKVHSAWTIWRAAQRNHYDVVTAQDPFWRGLLAWKCARLTGAKLNLQVHADLLGQSSYRRLLATHLLRHADSVRVVSEKIRQQVECTGTRAPTHILPIYIDTARLHSHEDHMPKPFLKTILWIGRLEKEKDPAMALSVLRAIREQIPEAGLTVLGSGSLVRELASEAADVVINTSPFESYGASIVEALSVGVPVVSLDVGVAREAGATITDVAHFADTVVHMLRNREKGKLALTLLSAEEWAREWRKTLI
jgi:glycosyltransferase involved in cell wall biosynthesis